MDKFYKELLLFWGHVQNDLLATIVPGMLFTLVSLSFHNKPIEAYFIGLSLSLIYFSFYAYSFTIVNQYIGIEEDLVNKPLRPIPSKKLDIANIRLKLIVINLLFLLLGYILNILPWALLWVFINIFHNSIGHKHWFSKNLISMTLGIFAMFLAGWKIVGPINQIILEWGIVISCLNGLCGVIQDFRDVEGDKKISRKTLTIDMGEEKGRSLSAIFILLSTLFITFFYLTTAITFETITFIFIFIVIYIVLIYRILTRRSPKEDHDSYTLLLIQFNLMIISGIFIL